MRFDGLPDVGQRLLDRLSLGVAARKGRDLDPIAAFFGGMKNDCVFAHLGSLLTQPLGNPRKASTNALWVTPRLDGRL